MMRGVRISIRPVVAVLLVIASARADEPATSGETSPANASKAVAFPVIIQPPAKTGAEAMKENDLAYVQTLRSMKAVRLTADHTVSYTLPSKTASFLADSNESVTLKSGTMLFQALTSGGPMYCAAVASKPDNFWTAYDVGVCLRDAGNDGTFDTELVVNQRPWRVRVPYEINQTGNGNWQPVSVAYQEIAPPDIPAFEFRVRYVVQHALLQDLSFILPEICWPASFVSRVNDSYANEPCAAFEDLLRGGQTLISDRRNTKGVMESRYITISYERGPDRALKTNVITTFQPGLGLLSVVARQIQVPGDGRDQLSVMRLKLLKARPQP